MFYKCEWEGCRGKFRSVDDLEAHVHVHVDGMEAELEGERRAGGGRSVGKPNGSQRDALPPPNGSSGNGSDLYKDTLGRDGGHGGGNDSVNVNVNMNVDILEEDDDMKCIICQDGREATGNCIVLCDGCDRAYHQACHRPVISAATVGDRNAKWYCKRCTGKKPAAS